MATYSLSDIRDAAAKRYQGLEITNGDDKFIFQNLLQLPATQRREADKILNSADAAADTDSQIELVKNLLKAVEKNGRGQELLDLLEDSPANLMEVFHAWMEATQPGEA